MGTVLNISFPLCKMVANTSHMVFSFWLLSDYIMCLEGCLLNKDGLQQSNDSSDHCSSLWAQAPSPPDHEPFALFLSMSIGAGGLGMPSSGLQALACFAF